MNTRWTRHLPAAPLRVASFAAITVLLMVSVSTGRDGGGTSPKEASTRLETTYARGETVVGRELVLLPRGMVATRSILEGPKSTASPPDECGWLGAAPAPRRAAQGDTATLWIDRDEGAIPERVAMTGEGLDIAAGWWLNSPRISHYLTTADTVPTLDLNINSEHEIPVDASYYGQLLAATGSLDSLYGINVADSLLYDLSYPPYYEGRFVATCDSGTVVVSAALRLDTTRVQVRSAATGDSLWAKKLPRRTVGLDLSSDGKVLAVTTNRYVHVYDVTTGTLLDNIIIPGETGWPAAISGDGSLIVTGGFTSVVRLFERTGSDYNERWHYDTGATYVTAVDVSDSGERVLVGTFTNTDPPFGMIMTFADTSSSPLWILAQFGDQISSVSLDSRGGYGAATSWGRQTGTTGYVLAIFGTDFWYPLVYTIRDDALPGVGSMLDVELADDGAYCVAGAKAVHAREIGHGGALVAIQLPRTHVGSGGPEKWAHYGLEWGRPNPANPTTVIPYRVPLAGGPADLAIFDVTGRRVRQLARLPEASGQQEAVWDGRDDKGELLPSGVYFCRLQGEAFSSTRKILLAR